MKKLIVFMIAALMIFAAVPQQANAQGAGSSISTNNVFPFEQIALDTVLVNSATDSSAYFSMDTWASNPLKGHNYFESSKVIVTARQVSDSVRGSVYIQVGQGMGTGANLGRTYSRPIYVDSLYKGHLTVLIDMSPYKMFPQAQVSIVAPSTGNGVNGGGVKWSAWFGGVGIMEITAPPAQSSPGAVRPPN
jgi:hypothetical protein